MALWLALRQKDLQPLITHALINEHMRNPTGGDRSHSTELMLVLNYVRCLAGSDKEFIYAIKPFEQYAIGRLRGRGSPVDYSDNQRFTTKAAADHAIFLRRLARLSLLSAAMFPELSEGGE